MSCFFIYVLYCMSKKDSNNLTFLRQNIKNDLLTPLGRPWTPLGIKHIENHRAASRSDLPRRTHPALSENGRKRDPKSPPKGPKIIKNSIKNWVFCKTVLERCFYRFCSDFYWFLVFSGPWFRCFRMGGIAKIVKITFSVLDVFF